MVEKTQAADLKGAKSLAVLDGPQAKSEVEVVRKFSLSDVTAGFLARL